MKRRENMRSSSSTSSRRETTPENHLTKNIGCISGIFHLLSKYQHRRKFITSASKQEKSVLNPSPDHSPLKPKPSPPPPENKCSAEKPRDTLRSSLDADDSGTGRALRRFSCDELRSPMIPSKIRLSNNNSDDSSSPRSLLPRSPAIIARLMGLDEIPAASPPPVSSFEKRRKLMEALEKCDEDLKVLKNIIETIRSTDEHVNASEETVENRSIRGILRKSSSSSSSNTIPLRSESDETRKCEVVRDIIRRSSVIRTSKNNDHLHDRWLFGEVVDDGDDSSKKEEKCLEYFNSSDEQPSPVSVLDVICDSPPRNHRTSSSRCSAAHHIGENKNISKKSRGEENAGFSRFQRITCEALPIRVSGRKGKGNDVQCDFINNQTLTFHDDDDDQSSIISSKAAKVESVNEISMDGVWGEKWEIGRIGVALEDHIFKMLVEETVIELGCGNYNISSFSSSVLLPFEKCRKRLLF